VDGTDYFEGEFVAANGERVFVAREPDGWSFRRFRPQGFSLGRLTSDLWNELTLVRRGATHRWAAIERREGSEDKPKR